METLTQKELDEIVYNSMINDLNDSENYTLKLSNYNLSRLSFKHVNIEKAYFRNCNLYNCKFIDCILVNSTFTNCDLTNCNFLKCDLEDSIFNNCNLKNINLKSWIEDMDYYTSYNIPKYLPLVCPKNGGFTAWTFNRSSADPLGFYIMKVEIDKNSDRWANQNGICHADKGRILEIYYLGINYDCKTKLLSIKDLSGKTYKIGDEISLDRIALILDKKIFRELYEEKGKVII